MQPTIVYLSLGANLGNREQSLSQALDLLSEAIGPLLRRSSFYYSAPWGFDSPNEFCNLCAAFETSLSPLELLDATQAVERQLGRTAKSHLSDDAAPQVVYHDRPIDIDILLYGDLCLSTDRLTLPHPLMTHRDFVMIPLREICDAY